MLLMSPVEKNSKKQTFTHESPSRLSMENNITNNTERYKKNQWRLDEWNHLFHNISHNFNTLMFSLLHYPFQALIKVKMLI